MSLGSEPEANPHGFGPCGSVSAAPTDQQPSDPSHRWPRAHFGDERYGPICECGNIKTDQALTCNDCAVERRRAPDHWQRRTCACGGPKTKYAAVCRRCRNKAITGQPATTGRPQALDHPWRKAEAARLARVA